MKHDANAPRPDAPSAAHAEALSLISEGLSAEDRLRLAFLGGAAKRTALVSSFGAESVALIHLVATVDPATPVLFVDTEMLFEETLDYQAAVARDLGLLDVRVIRPDAGQISSADPRGVLHRTDADRCCHLRKVAPLERALSGFDAWISGRKRRQNDARASLPVVEIDEAGRLKFNPLADWSAGDVRAHMDAHRLPRHPLVARGYPSLGCAPCTSPVAPGEDERAGRWRGAEKTECGIHFVDGKPQRAVGHQEAAEAGRRAIA